MKKNLFILLSIDPPYLSSFSFIDDSNLTFSFSSSLISDLIFYNCDFSSSRLAFVLLYFHICRKSIKLIKI